MIDYNSVSQEEYNKIKIGQLVYLKTDPGQYQRIVTGICEREHGFTYELSCGLESTWHSLVEISLEKDIILGTTN